MCRESIPVSLAAASAERLCTDEATFWGSILGWYRTNGKGHQNSPQFSDDASSLSALPLTWVGIPCLSRPRDLQLWTETASIIMSPIGFMLIGGIFIGLCIEVQFLLPPNPFNTLRIFLFSALFTSTEASSSHHPSSFVHHQCIAVDDSRPSSPQTVSHLHSLASILSRK